MSRKRKDEYEREREREKSDKGKRMKVEIRKKWKSESEEASQIGILSLFLISQKVIQRIFSVYFISWRKSFINRIKTKRI